MPGAQSSGDMRVAAVRATDTAEKPSRGILLGAVMPLLIVMAGIVAYRNGLSGPFLFDDVPIMQHLRGVGSRLANLTPYSRWVTDLTFSLNYSLGGLNAADFRAFNVIIHLLSGLLLWGIIRRTLDLPRFEGRYRDSAPWLALVAALLWVTHPLQTESVTYICQRYESLMGFFYLLSFYCFVRGASVARGRWWHDGAIAACLLGMGTKEVMVTAPLMILLYDYVFVSGSWNRLSRERWKVHVGLMASWVVLGLLMLGTQSHAVGGGVSMTEGQAGGSYFLTQFKVVLYYLRLAVVPHPLCLDYGWTAVAGVKDVWFSMIVVAALGIAVLIALWRRQPAGFLGAWFFVILLPTSSVVPVDDVIFEHRTYLSLAGVLVVAVMAGCAVLNRALLLGGVSGAWRVRLMGVIAVLLVVGSVVGTMARNLDYRSESIMWRDVVTKQPMNFRAWLGFGTALAQTDRLREAKKCFERIVEGVDPVTARQKESRGTVLCLALNNMGTLCEREARYGDAERYFLRALEVRPRYVEARNNLGIVLNRLGRKDEAEREWRTVLLQDPWNGMAHYSLAVEAAARGDYAASIMHFGIAVHAMPDSAVVKLAMAWFLATCEDPVHRDGRRAVELATEANELTGWMSSRAQDVLAAGFAATGDYRKAIRHAGIALELARRQGATGAVEIESRLRMYQRGMPDTSGNGAGPK